ncbi:MAG TPA: phage portal protein [Paenirhodobacter sp.]
MMKMMDRALSLVGLERKAGTTVKWVDGRDVEGGSVGDAGVLVDGPSTLGLSAAWACANLISGTISSLPCGVYRGGDVAEDARDHPLYGILHSAPNYDQTALDFWDFMCLSLELWGNAYARVERRGAKVIALYPVRPDIVQVRRLDRGSLQYSWSYEGHSYRLFDRDVLHIRGPGGDPLGGMSTLKVARNSFSSALAAETTAGATFRHGLRPSGIIKIKEWLSEDQRKQTKALAASYAGAQNAGKPWIAEGGMDFTPLSMTPEDAQMIETRQFSVEEICRFFGVPPVMIGHSGGSTAWPTSVEQQVLMFQKFTLRRRFKRIEMAVVQQLLSAEDKASGLFVKFNLEGLLRGDSAARSAFYRSMTQIGAMTINEVRALENLPPVAGGDEVRVQKQNVPITQTEGLGNA